MVKHEDDKRFIHVIIYMEAYIIISKKMLNNGHSELRNFYASYSNPYVINITCYGSQYA